MSSILRRIAFKFSKLRPGVVDATFIVGTGRSGTKFFAEFFSQLDSATLALHEPQPDLFDLGMGKFRESLSRKDIIREITKSRVEVLRNSAFKNNRYVESNPNCSLLLPEIKDAFPNAKFIIIIRNLDSYLTSAMNKNPIVSQPDIFFYGENDGRLRLRATDIDPHFCGWEELPRVQKIAWYWNFINTILVRYSIEHADQCLVVAFEDIFCECNEKRAETLSRILDFTDSKVDNELFAHLLQMSFTKVNETTNKVFEGMDQPNNSERQKIRQMTSEATTLIQGVFST